MAPLGPSGTARTEEEDDGWCGGDKGAADDANDEDVADEEMMEKDILVDMELDDDVRRRLMSKWRSGPSQGGADTHKKWEWRPPSRIWVRVLEESEAAGGGVV